MVDEWRGRCPEKDCNLFKGRLLICKGCPVIDCEYSISTKDVVESIIGRGK